MKTYTDLLNYQMRDAFREIDVRYETIINTKDETSNSYNSDISESEQDHSFIQNTKTEKSNQRINSIRSLLNLLIERKATIILDAEDCPEKVEIEAVIGDLLVAETHDRKIKFVDINCICAVIVDREELLESIFATQCCQI